MTSREFIVDSNKFDRRTVSEIQHKLRTLLKCYTIIGFILGENGTFTFKKSYMIRKCRFYDPKDYIGSYHVESIDGGKYKLFLTVNGAIDEMEKKKEND